MPTKPTTTEHLEEAIKSKKQAVSQSKWERAGSVGGRTKAPDVDTSPKAVKGRREVRKRIRKKTELNSSPLSPAPEAPKRVRKITYLGDQTKPSGRQVTAKQQGPSVKSAEYVGVGEQQMKGGKPEAAASTLDARQESDHAWARTQAATLLTSTGVFPSHTAFDVVDHVVKNHPNPQVAHEALGHLPGMIQHHGSNLRNAVNDMRMGMGGKAGTGQHHVASDLYRTGPDADDAIPGHHVKVLHQIFSTTGHQAKKIAYMASKKSGVKQGSRS